MQKKVYLILQEKENKRVAFGAEHLKNALKSAGYLVETMTEQELGQDFRRIPEEKIYVGIEGESAYLAMLEERELLLYNTHAPEQEGFYLGTCAGGLTVVVGGSATGALYGCLELRDRIRQEGGLPREIAFGDQPVYKLRGPVVGLQKTKIEPPRKTYEYPVTPSRFPWFYDKGLWLEYLDMMVEERCNVVYIWSGHPFASFIKLPDYPEAMEVTEEEYQQNVEVFRWLTEEADKRGIWVVLKFYNIHIPYPFAQKHKLELLQTAPTPLTSDYTRKSVAEFVRSFPHIGLMVCLGEALRGTQNQVEWFNEVILPGVKDGVRQAQLTEDPPVILRAHAVDAQAVMEKAPSIYSNLYTMWKYNGEGLTTWTPRGKWQRMHKALSALNTTTHIMNVHILANLEPFRWGAPSFVQKCMLAGENRFGTNGLHLYPMFYWDWPYSPDKAEPRLRQLDRDWLWYQTWFRYAWNPRRDPALEKLYWSGVMAEHFGEKAGEIMLDVYESFGECAPRVLRRVGITEGNRQTMSLGMTMSQLTNVRRYNPNLELWLSVAPQGERPDDYVQKELAGQPHQGETPYDMIADAEYYANRALEAVQQAEPLITRNREEFARVKGDVQAIWQMTHSYTNKVRAAMKILTYKYTMREDLSGDVSLLREAIPFMEKSLDHYRRLTAQMEDAYLYANSMQTPQRKIPFPNGDTYGHWRACLPLYEKELACFKKRVEEMEQGILPSAAEPADTGEMKPLTNAPFEIVSDNAEKYVLGKGCAMFTDVNLDMQSCAPELNGLTGVRFGYEDAVERGVTIELELMEDSKVLIGYFKAVGPEWNQVPTLETDTHADDRGGLAPVIKSAMKVTSAPPVDIHAFRYEKGRHKIFLGTGAFLIAGVIPAGEAITVRNAQMEKENLQSLDWLYE